MAEEGEKKPDVPVPDKVRVVREIERQKAKRKAQK